MRNRNDRFRVTVQSKAPSQVRIKSLWISGLILCMVSWLLTPSAVHAQEPSGGDLLYATQFSIEAQPDGTSLITIGDQDRFLLAPENVRDYVIVHELSHRRQMNHSPAFWAEVEHILPDYRVPRKWLKEHGAALMLRNPHA